MMKTCSQCRKERPLDDFGPRKGVPNARTSCRECDSAYTRGWRKRNLEQSRRHSREYMARERSTHEGAERARARSRKCYQNDGPGRQKRYLDRLKQEQFFKWKARKSYIHLTEQELESLWVAQGGRCALTGRLLDASAEVDHIVPKTRGGGYTFDNCRWLCREANQAKRDLLDEEFFALCEEMLAWRQRSNS